MRRMIPALIVLAALLACKKGKEGDQTQDAAPSASLALAVPSVTEAPVAPSASAVSDQELDKAKIPVKEDFEKQVAKTVSSAANLTKEVDTIEKEIKSDQQ